LRQLKTKNSSMVQGPSTVGTGPSYTISAWWPAGPRASNWTSQATYEIVAGSVVVASTNLDQTADGDQWHDIATVPLSATNPVYVRLTAPVRACVADALHIRSQSRLNNGQPASTVRLQPMDGIILQRDQRLLSRPGFGAVTVSSNSVALSVTNLTPGVTWTLERSTNPVAGAWQSLQAFQPSGFETRLVDSIGASRPNAFYRIRTD
jgi:hypothetical protein